MRGSSATTLTNYGYTSTSNNSATPSATSTSMESNVTTAGSVSSNSTVSFYTTSSSNSLSPSGFSTTTLNTGNSMKTYTELTSVFTTSLELSKSTVSSGTSSTWEDSAAFTSSTGHLSTTPTVSAQTDSDLTEGLTVYTGTPDLSKLTVTSDSTVSKGDGMSRFNVGPMESFTSGTADSFSTHVDSGLATPSFAVRSTFYIAPSELSTPRFLTHSSHSTDDASPASTSSPSELSIPTLGAGQGDSTLTGETTIPSTVPASSEPQASSPVSHAPGTGSSVAPWSPGEASPSPAVSGTPATGVILKLTDHTIISDSSAPTDTSVTTFTNEDGSPASTPRPSDTMSTSSSFGQTTTSFPVASTVSTNLSDSSDPTFSPDTSHTTDRASPSSPLGPGQTPTSPVVSGQTATSTFRKETTGHSQISDLSRPSASAATSYTKAEGGATSTSNPGQQSSSSVISGQTATGLTEGPSVNTDTASGSKPTSTSDGTVTKDDGNSVSLSGPAESFTTPSGDPHTATSFPPGSPSNTPTSEVSAPTFSPYSSYSTDDASPASQSGPSGVSTTTVVSEQSAMTVTGMPTVHTTSDSPESLVSSDSSRTSGPGSSEAPSRPGDFSTSPVGSGPTVTTVTQKSTDHSTISDSPQPPDSLASPYTKGDGSPVSTASPTESLATSPGSGPSASPSAMESTFSSSVSESPEYTVSSYTTGSPTPSPQVGFSTTSLTTGHSATASTGLPSVFPSVSDLSQATIASETSYTADDRSAVPSSSPGQLSTTLSVSAQTSSGLVEGSSAYPGTPHSSKPTVSPVSTISRGDGVPASTSGTADSFSTHADGGQATPFLAAGSTFYTAPSKLSTPVFPTQSSHSTDNASPASTSSPSELSIPTLGPGQADSTLKGETTILGTVPTSSEPPASSPVSHAPGTGSSGSSWSPGEASPSPAVSGITSSTVPFKPTEYSILPGFSQPTGSSATTFTKEDRSSVSTSRSIEPFTTSVGDDQKTFPPGSTLNTIISPVPTATSSFHSSYSTDKTSPGFPSSPSELTHPSLLSEVTTLTVTEESIVYTSVSDLSISTVYSESSFTKFEGSSASSSGSGHLSTTTGISQHTSLSLSDGSTVYTGTPDLSIPTVILDTTLSKESTSSASTSSSGGTFPSTCGYQETPTSFTVESTVSTILSDSSNPAVPHDTFYTTHNASPSSSSGPGELISTTLVSGQTSASLPEASTVPTTISDLSHSTDSVVTSSTTVKQSFISSPSSAESSSTTSVSGQTATIFMGKPTVYTISDLSGSTVSVDTSSTIPIGGPAPSSSSSLLPSTTITTITEESSVFTTTTYSSKTTDSSDAPQTTEDLSPLSSSSPIHSSSPPATSGQMPTTLDENSTFFITNSVSAKPMISTSIPSATDSPSPASPSALTFSSTTRLISRPTATTFSGGSTIFQSSAGIPNATISSNSSQTLVPGASSSASPIPGFSSRPVPDSSSALTTSSGFSPPLSSTPPGSTHAPVPGLSTSSTLHPLFTSTHTTVRTTQSSAITPRQCQNGTIWNGEECVCVQGFFGYQCKSLIDSFLLEIPEKVNATLGVTVKVTNRNFTKALNNISSPVYWNFTQLFESQMDKAYMSKDFPQYRGVIIRRLLNGSVVVEHDVVMEANYTSDYQKLFENLAKIIKVRIMNETKRLSGDSEVCRASSPLCYDEEATIVSKTVKLGFDLQEQCAQKAAKDYAQFYYVDELDGKLACVTKCTSGTKLQLNCHEGECQLQRRGPRCLCPTSDTHWYWGETCALSTSKSLVYGSVGAVGAVLVVTVVVLTVFLCRSQRKLHREEYSLSQEWHREDVPGSFQNIGIWGGTSHWEQADGSRKAEKMLWPDSVWPWVLAGFVCAVDARLCWLLCGLLTPSPHAAPAKPRLFSAPLYHSRLHVAHTHRFPLPCQTVPLSGSFPLLGALPVPILLCFQDLVQILPLLRASRVFGLF
ncbi:mucin-12-like isoform X2 [Eumetopias jubatus]|uniref:mucin-12-like isoform X2 n=1 Tax=Eumetopias jubatus TaxID=34886 RepID=UPI001015EDA9|nr:mucin-12-like isoform X2 [Eumetopias jubatus]